LPIKEQHHVEIIHSMFAEDIKYDEFNLPEDLRSSLMFAISHEQKTDIIYEQDIKQEGVSSQINSLLLFKIAETCSRADPYIRRRRKV
jgi:translation initiation factor 2 beta subunit (eIF-2beta)/eIF-5